jgi:hypothetical protein
MEKINGVGEEDYNTAIQIAEFKDETDTETDEDEEEKE